MDTLKLFIYVYAYIYNLFTRLEAVTRERPLNYP